MTVLAAAAVACLLPGAASAQQGQFCNPSDVPPPGFVCAPASDGRNRLQSGGSSSNTSGSSNSSSSGSVVTQADCDAGRITRNGRTLSRSECEALIGQRVNLASTGF